MVTSLTFQNYRGFTNYSLDGLARVNLLVGKNNSGKTAIIEGIHFLTSGGSLSVLADVASRRGETVMLETEETSIYRLSESKMIRYPNVAHFFHQHRIKSGITLSISTENEEICVRGEISNINDPDVSVQLKEAGIDIDPEAEFALSIFYTDEKNGETQDTLVTLLDDGSITNPRGRIRHSLKRIISSNEHPVEFVSPDSLDPSSLAAMWDKVTLEGREQEVIRALQILEPSLSDIRFLSGSSRIPGRFAGILVELEHDHKNRLPLGSFGDGMRRLLALAVSMIQSTNGVLLIDEIDTGLHYSVMGDLWRLIIEAARQANVQVFATTHSLDCLRGLAWLCEESAEYCADVSVHRIEPKLDHSVCFRGDEIVLAIQEEVEIR